MPRKRKLTDFGERCRLCLNRDNCMVELFANGLETQINDLAKCTDQEITNKTNYPKKICYGCLYKLEMWNEFKFQFIKTNKTLINHFKLFEPSLNDSIVSIESQTDDLPDNNKKRAKIDEKLETSAVITVKSDSSPTKKVAFANQINSSDSQDLADKKLNRPKKMGREASTKRWVERKNALIAATGETLSESESDNGTQMSPVQKAREEIKQKIKVDRALKKLQTNLTDKFNVVKKLNVLEERKTRSRIANIGEYNLMNAVVLIPRCPIPAHSIHKKESIIEKEKLNNNKEVQNINMKGKVKKNEKIIEVSKKEIEIEKEKKKLDTSKENVDINISENVHEDKNDDVNDENRNNNKIDGSQHDEEIKEIRNQIEGKNDEKGDNDSRNDIEMEEVQNDVENETVKVHENDNDINEIHSRDEHDNEKEIEIEKKNENNEENENEKTIDSVVDNSRDIIEESILPTDEETIVSGNAGDLEIMELLSKKQTENISSEDKKNIPFPPQLVTSEVTIGNATYIVTTTLDMPNSGPNNDISSKSNGINVDATSQSTQLDKVQSKGAKRKSGPDVQKCLKIEVEGMEVEALQRVQLDLAHYINEDIHRRLIDESDFIERPSPKPSKFKDSYENLNYQLRGIIEKVLRNNYMADKLNTSATSNHDKISPEFVRAAEQSPVFQPMVTVSKIKELEVPSKPRHPVSRTEGKRKLVLPKKYEDYSIYLRPEDDEERRKISRPNSSVKPSPASAKLNQLTFDYNSSDKQSKESSDVDTADTVMEDDSSQDTSVVPDSNFEITPAPIDTETTSTTASVTPTPAVTITTTSKLESFLSSTTATPYKIIPTSKVAANLATPTKVAIPINNTPTPANKSITQANKPVSSTIKLGATPTSKPITSAVKPGSTPVRKLVTPITKTGVTPTITKPGATGAANKLITPANKTVATPSTELSNKTPASLLTTPSNKTPASPLPTPASKTPSTPLTTPTSKTAATPLTTPANKTTATSLTTPANKTAATPFTTPANKTAATPSTKPVTISTSKSAATSATKLTLQENKPTTSTVNKVASTPIKQITTLINKSADVSVSLTSAVPSTTSTVITSKTPVTNKSTTNSEQSSLSNSTKQLSSLNLKRTNEDSSTVTTPKRERHLCGICGKEFYSTQEANIHMEQHRAQASKAASAGSGNATTAATTNSVNAAKNNAEKPKPKLMRCKRCQAIVEAKEVKTHICNSTKYNCDLCECTFGAEHLLTEHLETHAKQARHKSVKTAAASPITSNTTSIAKTTRVSPVKDKSRVIANKVVKEKVDNKKPLKKQEQKKDDAEDSLSDKDPQNYSCFVCNKVFVDEQQIKDHLQMHCDEVSEDIEKNNIQCAFCGEKFQNEESLEEHVTHHLKEDGDEKINMMINLETRRDRIRRTIFRCEQCNETFSSSMQLAMHLPVHKEEEEEEEDVDDETTEAAVVVDCEQEEAQISQQVPEDTTEELVCTVCDEIFDTEDELDYHLKAHNGSIHVCILCEKPFASIRDLQNHVSSHL